MLCELLLHCTKPETLPQTQLKSQAESDSEAVPPAVPDTVFVTLAPDQPRHPLKKSKQNSAVYSAQEALGLKVGESVECALCRLAMESIDQLIAANSTEVGRAHTRLCSH